MTTDTTYTTQKYSPGVNTRQYIIVHHTASDPKVPDTNVVKYLALNPTLVSCHYIVGKDGTVYQIAETKRITRHAGLSKWDGKTDLNRYSIGIEVISDGYQYTDKQKVAVKELLQFLMDLFKIPATCVLRHADITERKWDIGEEFYKPMTRKQYQESLTVPVQSKQAIKANGELWEIASEELRTQLSQTNQMIRKFYNL